MKMRLSQAELAAELERFVWIASDQYMQGKIDADKLEAIERPIFQNLFKDAVFAQAKQNYIKTLTRRLIVSIFIVAISLLIALSIIIILITKNALILVLPILLILTSREVSSYVEDRTQKFLTKRSLPIIDSHLDDVPLFGINRYTEHKKISGKPN